MKNNNNIGQELSEFKPVELVDYEDEEAGSPDALSSMVVQRDNGSNIQRPNHRKNDVRHLLPVYSVFRQEGGEVRCTTTSATSTIFAELRTSDFIMKMI